MDTTVKMLLEGKQENHIMPFLWMHGEEEPILREYMQVIHDANIGAVCVESRPHPDFCGEGWWKDMNIILDEAKRLDMKVWILDDSHFPTGYANGALEEAPEELCRQGICYHAIHAKTGKVNVNVDKFLKRKNDKLSFFDLFSTIRKKRRVYSPDSILSATAVCVDTAESIDLLPYLRNGKISWVAPKGNWKIGLCKLSRNCGAHRNYINMMDENSCKVLLNHVYEPHWEHYRDEFGKTIAGFFSDEPELGNGAMYSNECLGADQDLPWSKKLVPELEKQLGKDWKNKLLYLWENDMDADETARIRYAYMDAVTKSVKEAFSMQIGNWCREHGVEYIGHMVEDNNNHARTGGSLGHYFRGLAGQDMAGIDDIGGQVMPQGEDDPNTFMKFQKRDGEFYHYILGRLGPSLAAIDPRKQGRTMCEIFGNYGWADGLRLENFLAAHFMVNGVNYFVPHAFSPKEFPDSDCPPHFYANGHNPQYRHFASLMNYMNRVCELISGGRVVSSVALLYHGEAEWTGKCMLMQKPARRMWDEQITFDIIPTDVFVRPEEFRTDLVKGFRINTQEYKALVVPYAQYISQSLANAIQILTEQGIPVIFLNQMPDGCYDSTRKLFLPKECKVTDLENLTQLLWQLEVPEIRLSIPDNRIRCLHYRKEKDLYYFINEGTDIYQGEVELPQTGSLCRYDAWDNVLEQAEWTEKEQSSLVELKLEPYQSCIFILDEEVDEKQRIPLAKMEKEGFFVPFEGKWIRSIGSSLEYPEFTKPKEIVLPDHLSEEMPKFSGWVRYENSVRLSGAGRTQLLITDAYEGVEVMVNGMSAGVQIVPPYRFDITELVREGVNQIMIDVSTTLERERAAAKNQTMTEKLMRNKVLAPTGITGEVRVYEEV